MLSPNSQLPSKSQDPQISYLRSAIQSATKHSHHPCRNKPHRKIKCRMTRGVERCSIIWNANSPTQHLQRTQRFSALGLNPSSWKGTSWHHQGIDASQGIIVLIAQLPTQICAAGMKGTAEPFFEEDTTEEDVLCSWSESIECFLGHC